MDGLGHLAYIGDLFQLIPNFFLIYRPSIPATLFVETGDFLFYSINRQILYSHFIQHASKTPIDPMLMYITASSSPVTVNGGPGSQPLESKP